MIYVAVFVAVLAGLIYFVGVDFDFEEPDVVLEGRDNFLEIRTTLEQIESDHDFARFRTFTLIPPFEDIPGRSNPFNPDGIEPADLAEEGSSETEGRGDDLFELPEEETEPIIEETEETIAE